MPAKNIVWNWRDALFGLALAVPGAVVILSGNVKPGIALLVGVLAAAGVEVPPTRKRRIRIFIIGLVFAVSIVVGAFLAQWPIVAVVGIALIALGSAQLAARKLLGVLVMSLALPLIGIGFSYDLQGAASFATRTHSAAAEPSSSRAVWCPAGPHSSDYSHAWICDTRRACRLDCGRSTARDAAQPGDARDSQRRAPRGGAAWCLLGLCPASSRRAHLGHCRGRVRRHCLYGCHTHQPLVPHRSLYNLPGLLAVAVSADRFGPDRASLLRTGARNRCWRSNRLLLRFAGAEGVGICISAPCPTALISLFIAQGLFQNKGICPGSL